MSENPTKQRLRIVFGKFGALKYTSNLDVAKIWERILRRADLPLLYSQGFNTRPRLQLATALPLGITSECELLDVSLREVIPLDGVGESLQAVSPEGMRIYNVEDVDISEPALQTRVRSSQYCIHFPDGLDTTAVQARVDSLLAQETLLVQIERKRKAVDKDLRPLIFDIHFNEQHDLIIHVAVGDQGNVRPRDILNALALQDQPHIIHRQALFLE
jgi:radical SAM-linked protein